MKYNQEVLDAIHKALGERPFYGQTGDEILKKILADHLVCQRAQELMVAYFSAAAISEMHPAERAALIKRCSPPPAPPKPVHLVSWQVSGGLISGRVHIHGACGRCGQDVNFAGNPDQAAGVVWSHCTLGPSKIPAAIIEEYKNRHGFTA